MPAQADDQGPPLFDFFGLGHLVLASIAVHGHQLIQNQGNMGLDQNMHVDQNL